MNHRYRYTPWLAVALLASLALPTFAEEPAPREPDVYSRQYIIRNLNIHEAEVLAWDQCPEAKGEGYCRVSEATVEGGAWTLTVLADAPTHERLARALVEKDGLPRTQTFQMILLLADNQPETNSPQLPKGAAKAIEDLRQFLPFRRYTAVDRATVSTFRKASVSVADIKGAPLEVRLVFTGRVGDQLSVEQFQVVAGPGTNSARDILSTSFSIKVGETLVVGTSKLDGGDEALVVLLTAEP